MKLSKRCRIIANGGLPTQVRGRNRDGEAVYHFPAEAGYEHDTVSIVERSESVKKTTEFVKIQNFVLYFIKHKRPRHKVMSTEWQ